MMQKSSSRMGAKLLWTGALLSLLLMMSAASAQAGTVEAWGRNDTGLCDVPSNLVNVVELANGDGHTLALESSGLVTGWGNNTYGQCTPPIGLSNVVTIAASGMYSLALKSDGTVSGWGNNSWGAHTVPAGLSNVVAIAAGNLHALALKADGTLVLWGYHNPVPAGLANVVAIAAGEGYSLALKSDGTVVSWGNPARTNLPAGLADVVALSAKYRHNLALKSDGSVVAWGENGSGQCNVPANATNVVDIAVGVAHSLALLADGTVVGWGLDNYGQCTGAASIAGAAAIAAGSFHGLAIVRTEPLESDTQAPALYGNLPRTMVASNLAAASMPYMVRFLDDTDPHPSISYVPPLGSILPEGTTTVTVTATDASGNFSQCSFDVSMQILGTVAWGNSAYNRLAVPGNLAHEIDVAAGWGHTLALDSDGIVTAWGYNGSGQCNVPAGLSGVVAVAAGDQHSVALKSDGTIVAWGGNGFGQCNVPDGLADVVAISSGAGALHSLALRADGTVVAWGYAAGGVCDVPENLAGVIAVAGGAGHNLALRMDGTVVAWGQNWAGQCNVPAMPAAVVAIAAGGSHSLALCADGTVVAWGDNGQGQCNVPAIPAAVIAIAAGGSQNLALCSDGTVAAWGDNSWGQCNVPSALSGAIDIAAGSMHSVAILRTVPLENDMAPPALYGCDARTVVAPTPDGARVTALVRALDDTDAHPAITYDPLPESLLPLGETNVVVTATDASGNTDLCSFAVTVLPDTVSPVINGCSNRVLGAYSQAGLPLPALVTVTDNADPNPTLTYTPPLGTILELGIHSIDVEARDAFGNTTLCTLSVTVVFQPVVAWGNNDSGQRDIPEGLSNVVQVAAGLGYGLALHADGTVTPWGDDSNGQCSGAAGLMDVVQIVAASANGMALHANGTVSVWGNNYHGQCVVPADLTNAVKIAGCQYNLLALRADGTVVNWGLVGNAGYLNVPPGLAGVVDIAAGEEFFLALKADGTVVAWGNDMDGQCSGAEGLTDIVQIAAGHYHGLGLKADGTVVAWGWDGDGACSVPPGLSNVVAIAGAENHSLALLSDGTMESWGADGSGQCAIPTGLSEVVDISAGSYFSLALVRETALEDDDTAPAIFGDDDQVVSTTNPEGALMAFQVRVFDDTDPNPAVTYDPPLGALLPLGSNLVTVAAWDAAGNTNVSSFSVTVMAPQIVAWGYNGSGQCDVPDGLTDVVRIAAGSDHNLALRSNGTVVAWGYNGSGQCDSPTGLSDVVALAAGWYHSLALRSDGTVMAWGGGSFGENGVPEEWNDIVAISSIAEHNLALRANGTVVAWGNNNNGQCNVPEGLNDAVAVAAGMDFSLALKSDGTVVGWGNDGNGQCSGAAGLTNVAAIAAGYEHGLALMSDGTVVAWGGSNSGQLILPEGLSGVVAIAGGGYHSMAIKADGTIETWGANGAGQLDLPVGLSGVVAIAAGCDHSIALLGSTVLDTAAPAIYGCEDRVVTTSNPDGVLMACQVRAFDDTDPSPTVTYAPPLGALLPLGANAITVTATDVSGNISICTFTIAVTTPRVVVWGADWSGQCDVPDGLADVVAIASGSDHVLAVRPDGTVVAWGYNGSGQCDLPTGLSDVVAMAAGWSHSLALRSDGTVMAWGGGNYGENSVPPGLKDVVAISSIAQHNLALRANGTVIAWGDNNNGQCNVPEDLTGVVAIAAGMDHSLALLADGTVRAWGGDNYGQCQVPAELANVVAIAAGYEHSLALLDDGTVVAWGGDNYGQLGIPLGLSGVVAIAGGGYHSLALKADGTIETWGADWSGQLVLPNGLSGVVAIAAGCDHSIALLGSGDEVDAMPPAIYGCEDQVVAVLDSAEGAALIHQVRIIDDTDPRPTVVYDPPLGSLIGAGTTPVTVTAWDASGNTNSCTFTVTVKQAEVWAWGNNEDGQCEVPSDLSNVVAIASGSGHVLALKSDGTVTAWGYNWDGQSDVPAGLTGATAISAGTYHNLVLVAGGEVRAWGQNNDGQCDVPEEARSGVTAISAGASHSLALKSDGTVLAWGQNSYGECDIPLDLGPVTAISAGAYYSLALQADGTVRAWGANWNSTCNIDGLTGATAISAGSEHSMALLADGTVVAYGQPVDAIAWTPPEGLTDVVAISAGQYHSMALKSDGSLELWGYDWGFGELEVPAGMPAVSAIAAAGMHYVVLLGAGGDGEGDTTAPAIAGCDTETVLSSGAAAAVDYAWITVTDDVDPNPTVEFDPPAGSPLAVGEHLVGVTAWDASGNTNSCTFTVTVSAPAPVLSTTNANVREGGTGRFFVKLDGPPAGIAAVSVARAAGDTNLTVQGGAQLRFSAANWNAWQAVTLAQAADANAVGETATIRISMPGAQDAFVEATALDGEIGENLALAAGGTTVQGTLASGVGRLIDGVHNASTNYGWTIWTNDPPGTVTLDLKAAVAVSRVRVLAWDWAYRTARYRIESSVDGAEWTLLADGSAADRHGWDDWAVAGETMRYVRFTGLADSYNQCVVVSELEVYGTRPAAAVEVSPAAVNVREGGEGRFFVRLGAAPTQPVALDVERSGGDASLEIQGGAVLKFTEANWNAWQAVTLAQADDAGAESETATIRISAPGFADTFVEATALDDDVGENLALASGGTTVQGTLASGLGRLIDGVHNASTNYGWTIWTNDPPGAVTLDLKAAASVSRVRLRSWDWVYRVHRYKVETSTDGATWSILADAGAEDRLGWDEWTVPARPARYVRFTGLSNSANQCVVLSELEVYGTRGSQPAPVLSATAVNVREAGEGRFFVRLASAPAENVVFAVARTAGDTNVAVQSGASLTFKPTTWDAWQAVTLAAGADENAADETATFRVSAPGFADTFVTATALDKDLGVNWALAANGSTIAGVRASLPARLIDGIHLSSANYGYAVWTNSLGLAPGTMTLDLKVATALSRVRLQNYDWSYRPNRYKIESSLDGAGWSPLIDASTGDRSGWDDWALAGQSVRYLRFTGLSNAASFAVCVAELEVYGTRPETRRSLASAAAEAAETESVPVTVLTSDGPEDESGWAAVDGDAETAWIGRKTGGGYVVVEYAPTLTLRALEVDLAEGSLTNVDYLFSHDAIDWQPLPEGLETNPVSLNFLWLVFPGDGMEAVPQVLEIRSNP